MKRGNLFVFSRFFVRLGIGRWSVDAPPPEGPTVYVCSHGNLRGPLATLCWLPFAVRPWVLHVFTEEEACRAQYRDYTFSQRFGMPKAAASAAALFCFYGFAGPLPHNACSPGGAAAVLFGQGSSAIAAFCGRIFQYYYKVFTKCRKTSIIGIV